MRRSQKSRLSPYQVGLIALIVLVVAVFLGASKDIPFTRPFELKAVFENAPPILKNQSVRIAGVEVGKVSKVEPVGGDSPAVVVTMKMKDEALPIHKDATIKVRPRLFFEGNLFFDVKPGTPQSRRRGQRRHDPGRHRPLRPCSSTRCSGSWTPTRAMTCGSSWWLRERHQRQAAAGRGRGPGSDTKGETAGKSLNDTSGTPPEVAARRRDRQRHDARHRAARPLQADRRPAEDFAALSSREGTLKDLITN